MSDSNQRDEVNVKRGAFETACGGRLFAGAVVMMLVIASMPVVWGASFQLAQAQDRREKAEGDVEAGKTGSTAVRLASIVQRDFIPLFSQENLKQWRQCGPGHFTVTNGVATGEGGMACTDSQKDADRMRIMSLHGISRDAWMRYTSQGSWYYEIVAPGYKYNLTDLAAAIGLHQLRKADKMHERRSQRAQLYSELLGDIDELILPRELPDRIHSWHLYPIRLQKNRQNVDRSSVISQLRTEGISTSVHWMPLHLHPYYRDALGYKPSDCPCATSLYPELISLPLYPDLAPEEVKRVCESLKRILTGKKLISVGTDLETVVEEKV